MNQKGQSYNELVSKAAHACALKKDDLGAKLYREAIAAEPSRHKAYVGLAFYHSEKKQFQKALDLSETALSLAPNDVTCLRIAAQVKMQLKKLTPALELYKQALAIEPQHANTLGQVARIHYRWEEDDLAKEYAKKALAVDPENMHGLVVLALHCLKINKVDQGVQLLRKAVRAHPNNHHLLETVNTVSIVHEREVISDREMQHIIEAQLAQDASRAPVLAEKLYDAHWGQHWIFPTTLLMLSFAANVATYIGYISSVLDRDLFEVHLFLIASILIIYHMLALAFTIHTYWEPIMMRAESRFKKAMSIPRRQRAIAAFVVLTPASICSFFAALSGDSTMATITLVLWTLGAHICFQRIINGAFLKTAIIISTLTLVAMIWMLTGDPQEGLATVAGWLYVTGMLASLFYAFQHVENNQFAE